jgi:hypothetical protein
MTPPMKEIRIGNKAAYARRVPASGRIEFRYADDGVWFYTNDDLWQGLSPDSLRAIADLKEHR